jgi:uncharacterized coiled-coil DUF342 family protein
MKDNQSPFDSLVLRVRNAGYVEAADMLQQQAKEIEQLNFVLKNLTLATNKKINELEEEIEHLRKIVEDAIKQAFYEDDYHKLKEKFDAQTQEIEHLKNKVQYWKGLHR